MSVVNIKTLLHAVRSVNRIHEPYCFQQMTALYCDSAFDGGEWSAAANGLAIYNHEVETIEYVAERFGLPYNILENAYAIYSHGQWREAYGEAQYFLYRGHIIYYPKHLIY